MKRTIEEIYNIIIQKRDNATKDKERIRIKAKNEKNADEFAILLRDLRQINGEIEAYTDVLCLIESSQVLDE